jgi:4'-phosphopantetheinyl transferase EntD
MLPPRSSPERIATPHGTVVLLELGGDDELAAALAALPAPEREHAGRFSVIRLREHVTGRTALHVALGDLDTPILADDRGAPLLPAGWVGSISHKGALAAALAAPAGDGWVGVDLERAVPPRMDIARRVLTAREQAAIAHLGEGPDRGRAVTLRFAIKEAIYKAIDPHLRRYVGFTEVELDLDGGAGGACTISHALPLAIEAAWREHAGHWLATARARL